MAAGDRLRQCGAHHGQKMYLRCQGEFTESTVHINEHRAIDRDGQTVRWDDLMAMYPVLPDVVSNGSARDRQVAGSHYDRAIQIWDIVEVWELDFFRGSALKYLLRAGNKGSALEDLRKCRHVLDKLIEREEGR